MTILLSFFLGASLGSFIGLLVERFPEKSIVRPRSYCDACGQALALRDLIPVFSQLINKSRCRFCSSKIPLWYAFLEAALGFSTVLWGLGLQSNSQLFIILFSVPLMLYDFKNQTFPFLVWLLPTGTALLFIQLNSLALILFLLGAIAELVDLKIGSGDFLYLGTLALLLPLQSLLWLLFIASLLGIACCLILQQKRIPFVPFLFIAYAVVGLAGMFGAF